jgi:ABC-2 type transport system permease protein
VGRTTAPSSISVVALGVMVAVAVAVTLTAGSVYRRRDVV